jgi:hypothetical protein
MGVYLINVHATGVHLMGAYPMGVHLIGVYLMGIHLRRVLYGRIFHLTNGGACGG